MFVWFIAGRSSHNGRGVRGLTLVQFIIPACSQVYWVMTIRYCPF
ncbi:hypothetical protein SeW_A4759 [Salmonella enterica subsp. enterica serovar Weltevreden str. HI_N05-537]|nr:hypothetical protein SeW_A4759 [Salmonella enterica subsp. enterica serovar Weltevreden str. HI_N05-537]